MSTVDPKQFFENLLSHARPQKRRNLEIMQQVCAELHRLGSRDFSLATVGRMSEERGGMSCRALYNTTSTDFKALIKVWSDFAEVGRQGTRKGQKQQRDVGGESALLQKIADPALRALVGYIIAERDRLRGEVKVLRAHADVVVDRRVLPGHVNITQAGQVIQVMERAGLSDTEKHALGQAIAEKFLAREGWSEGPNGEILNARGRKLFDIGFANAVRKILSAE